MTTNNKAAQTSEINTNFADNTTGLITPALLRSTVTDMVNSYQQAPQVNTQTGTTYTFQVGDYGNVVTFSNGASIAVTLPQAVSTFAVWNVFAKNLGAGVVTITPTTSTINGAATLTLGTGQSAFIVSDGTNYQAILSSNVVSVSSPLSLSSGVLSVTGAAGEIPNGTTGAFTATPSLGVAGSLLGTLSFSGNTSGTITIQPQAAAGTYNFNLPTSAGSSGQPLLSGGGGATAQSYGTLSIGAGGTGQITAAAARGSSGLNIDEFTGHGDSIYTILATDRVVGTNAAFTASRTWTLPAANAVNAGQRLIVADFQGTVTNVNTLVIARAGADTINGGTSVTISAANGAFEFISDGTSKWTGQAIGAATTAGVSSVGGLSGAITLGTGLNTSGASLVLSASSLTNSLAGDVTLNNTTSYFTGPTTAQGTSGTWLATATVTVVDSVGAAAFDIRIWDGTTVFASSSGFTSGAAVVGTLSVSGVISSPAGNITVQVKDKSSTSGLIKSNVTGSSKDSTLTVVRIA